MTRMDYQRIMLMLDNQYRQIDKTNPSGIDALSDAGKVTFARRIAGELQDFCRELVARAKAEHESAVSSFEQLKQDFGDGFDEITPDYNG